MGIRNSARFTTACLFAGALACASGTARVDDDAAAAPQDTTTAEPPPGYSGMEQDTTMMPDTATATDTFLQEQGTGVPADTQGYGGFEQPDTTAAQDTTGYQPPDQPGYDTTGQTGYDTTGQTGYDTTGTGYDTTGQTGYDTTGYGQPDQPGAGWGEDTSGMTGQTDTSGWSGMDTTGYDTGQDTMPQ